MTRPRPSALYFVLGVLGRTVARLGWRQQWAGAENLPAGPFIVVSNHLSSADPVTLGHFLVHHKIYPRYLAKDSLFKNPLIHKGLNNIGAIPVVRASATSAQALEHAATALRDGHVVTMYPEGTFTHDPDLWPMRGKTGAVRLALQTGVPVVPVAQWAPHELLKPGSSIPRLWPRKTMWLKVGEPIDMAELVDALTAHGSSPAKDSSTTQDSGDPIRLATDHIMSQLTSLVADLRARDTHVR